MFRDNFRILQNHKFKTIRVTYVNFLNEYSLDSTFVDMCQSQTWWTTARDDVQHVYLIAED